jgi:hypothetical protein
MMVTRLCAAIELNYPKTLYLNNKPGTVSLPFVITVKGAEAKDLPPNGAAPQLADNAATQKAATKVAFTWQKVADTAAPAAPGDRTLHFTATVSAFDKAGDNKPRGAELTLGGQKLKVAYAIAAGAPAAEPAKTAWSALPIADPWVLSGFGSGRQCTSLAISAGSDDTAGVNLIHSTLLEDTTKKPLTRDELRICKDDCSASAPFDLPANTPVSVTLCVLNPTRPGVFKGNIYLAAANRPDTLTVPLDIQASLFWYKLAGVVLLGMGVWLAVIVIPYMRAGGTRDQELLLAARRRPEVSSLLNELQGMPVFYRTITPVTQGMLNSVLEKLSTNNLEKFNYLSPAEPSPLTQTVDSAGYTAFLAAIDAEIANLAQIVDQGILSATKLSAPQDDIEKAIGALDAISRDADTAALKDIETSIDAVLEPLSPTAAAKSLGSGRRPAAARRHHAAAREKTAAELEKDLKHRKFWLNSILVLLTVTSGTLVLITSKPGFGVPQDYIYCLLWGFGLPVAGQQLTPASVKTAITS